MKIMPNFNVFENALSKRSRAATVYQQINKLLKIRGRARYCIRSADIFQATDWNKTLAREANRKLSASEYEIDIPGYRKNFAPRNLIAPGFLENYRNTNHMESTAQEQKGEIIDDIVDELVRSATLNITPRKKSAKDIETTEKNTESMLLTTGSLLAKTTIPVRILFNKKWRIATLNADGSPETPKYVQQLMSNHNVNIIGVTETHLHPESKIRTE